MYIDKTNKSEDNEMKKIFLFAFVILAINLIYISNVSATIFNCDGSYDDCQAKITAASDGDIITLPEGTFNWDSSVSWTNKNIDIIGSGEGITTITTGHTFGAFYIIATTKANFRISNLSINQGVNGKALWITNLSGNPTGGTYSPGWRFDHLEIIANGLTDVRSIYIKGLSYGVIDNVTWSSDYPIANFLTHYAQSDNVEVFGTFGMGTVAWSLNHSLGDNNAIYVEDCTINGSSTGGWAADVWYGGEVVFRHNAINRCQISTHGARYSARGGRRIEAYNNSFVASGMNDKRVIWWRSGSGVAFNNTIDSAGSIVVDNQRTCLNMATRCDGINGNAYDMNIDGNGWPCLDQVGRWQGSPLSQSSEPVYAWHNGTQADCATDQSTCVDSNHINVNIDFDLCTSDAPPSLSTHLKTIGDASPHTGGVIDYINNGSTPKPGYASYTYPHPLRNQAQYGNITTGGNGSIVISNTGSGRMSVSVY